MNETELQDYPWDVSIEYMNGEGVDTIMIDLGDCTVFLTKSDLTDMCEAMS